ncbi:MAG TPA: hypothetical protein PK995_09270 [Bacteroidia bacterium]|nr:hypothetical protein [Bacteroidia bacterium]
MDRLLLNDVGDGLNLIIEKSERKLFVDFGGKKIDRSKITCIKDTFLLSHFHLDHYNGFFKKICKSNYPHPYFFHQHRIIDFYYPKMPSFEGSQEFLYSLFSINILSLLMEEPIELMIFKKVLRNNLYKIKFKPVSKGDYIFLGGSKFEILWPPESFKDNDNIKKVISVAIENFNEAKKESELLRKIYDLIYEESKNIDNLNIELIESIISKIDNDNIRERIENSEKIKNVNESLRRAANRLSISFRQEDNILFLGDLESDEIKIVIDDLIEKKNIFYDVIIAAHHGTHWNESLRNIKSNICLVSVGDTLRKNLRYEYKSISKKLIRTDEWGNIILKKEISVN